MMGRYSSTEVERIDTLEARVSEVYRFLDLNEHCDPWARAPAWALELKFKLEHIERMLMSEFDEVKATLTAVGDKVSKVKTDVETLQAQVAAIPTPGMTDEQKAALAEVTASANNILASISAVDDMTPDPA